MGPSGGDHGPTSAAGGERALDRVEGSRQTDASLAVVTTLAQPAVLSRPGSSWIGLDTLGADRRLVSAEPVLLELSSAGTRWARRFGADLVAWAHALSNIDQGF